MFGHRYFGQRYFGNRYWGDGGSVAPVVPVNYGRQFRHTPLRGVDEAELEISISGFAREAFVPRYLDALDVAIAELSFAPTAATTFLRHFRDTSNARIGFVDASLSRFEPALSLEKLQAQIAELNVQIRAGRLLDIGYAEIVIGDASTSSFDGWIRKPLSEEEVAEISKVLHVLH